MASHSGSCTHLKQRDVDDAKLYERSTFLRGAPLHEAALTQSVRPSKQPTCIARCCTWFLDRTPLQQRSPFGSPCPAGKTMAESMDDVDALLEQQLKATKTDENDRSGHEGRKRDEREKHSDRCGSLSCSSGGSSGRNCRPAEISLRPYGLAHASPLGRGARQRGH